MHPELQNEKLNSIEESEKVALNDSKILSDGLNSNKNILPSIDEKSGELSSGLNNIEDSKNDYPSVFNDKPKSTTEENKDNSNKIDLNKDFIDSMGKKFIDSSNNLNNNEYKLANENTSNKNNEIENKNLENKEEILWEKLTSEQKQELVKLGINKDKYNRFEKKYKDKDSFKEINEFVKIFENLDILFSLGSDSSESLKNLKLMEEKFGLDTIKNMKIFYKNGIKFSNIIKNINISKENNIELSANNLFDLGNNIIDKNSVEFLKLNNKLSIKEDIKMFDLYGVSKEELKNLMETKKEVFDFFENINIDKHYVVELAKIGFNPKDFKGYEKIFTGRTIGDIVALLNRENNVSNEDIKFYFTFFEGKLDKVNHNTCSYIEIIDNLVSGNIEKIKNDYKNKTLIETYIDLKSKKDEKIYQEESEKELGKVKKYKESLGTKGDYLDLKDVQKYLYNNKIKIKDIKPFLDFKFSAKGLQFLGTENLWQNYPNIDEKGKLKIIKSILDKGKEISKNFTGADIMNLIYKGKEELKNNLDLNIDKYLRVNSDFTGADIYEFNDFFGDLNKEEVSKIIKKYEKNFGKLNGGTIKLVYNFEQKGGDVNELKNLKEKFGDFSFSQLINLLEKNISEEDISGIYKNVKGEYKINDIYNILINGITYEKYNNFKKIHKENDIIKKINIIEYNNLVLSGLSNEQINILDKNYLETINLVGGNKEHQYKKNLSELSKMKNIGSLLDFLENNKDLKIKIGKQDYKVHGNLQFLRQILNNVNKNLNIKDGKNINWKEVIKDTGNVLNGFVETSKTIDKVFFLSSNHYYGEDHSNYQYKNKKILESIYGKEKIMDFTTGTKEGNKLEKSSDMINILEKTLEKNKNEEIMLYVGLHGDIEGNAWTSKGSLSKSDFSRINKISKKYENLKIIIDSCNNGFKFKGEKLEGNIESNSKDYYSVESYGKMTKDATKIGDDGFKKGDLNKDGKLTGVEVDMYRFINYQDGGINNTEFTKSFYKNKDGKNKNIDKYILNTK